MAPERIRAIAARAGVLAGAPAAAGLELRQRLALALEIEWDRGRAVLWLPVAFGLGILLYGAAPRTPEAWAGPLAATAALAAAWRFRGSLAGIVLGSAAAALALGFSAATLEEVLRAGDPILLRPLRAEAAGRIETIEPRLKDRRLYLSLTKLGDLDAARMPKRVRVVVPKEPPLQPGDLVRVTATWRPPPGPLRPGGYDFARVAFAEGIGAFGARAEGLRKQDGAPATGWAGWSAAVERLRLSLTERIIAAAGGTAGAIAAALVTGVRSAIPPAADDAMRAAGLSHVLSISGMHLALVAGVLFAGARMLLAAIPQLALRRPIKSWAAFVALAGSAFYLVLSGAEVATQRAFVMAAIVLVAVAVGRAALTMRNVAIAAVLVLVVAPQSVLGASFQMSFAAVLALVAGFETGRLHRPQERGGGLAAWATGWLGRFFLVMLATTLLAGIATAPFAAFHFHRLTPYSLLGNLLALPVVSLWIMPAAVVAALLVPFGLDGYVWPLMGAGVEAMLAIARFVAALPGAERAIPAFGPAALLCLVAALLAATLLASALRWLALPVAGLGILLAATTRQPEIYVDQEGRAVAVRGPDGRLEVAGARFASLAAGAFLEADGDDAKRRYKPGPGVRCDEAGCILPLADGRLVALVYDVSAFGEDCRRAAMVVTKLDAPPGCRTFAAVIDRGMLAVTGSIALYRDGTAFRLVAARDPGAERAWFGRTEAARLAAAKVPRILAPDRPAPPVTGEESEEADGDPLDFDGADAAPDDQ
jgi:competence protein ComEC